MKRLFLLSAILFSVLAAGSGLDDVEIIIRGGDEQSFNPPITGGLIHDTNRPQVVVVGGGVAGLTGALYLSDQQLKVLVLEKEPQMGGAAASGEMNSHAYNRGAAYWADTYDEQQKIFEHIGLGNYQQYAIPGPIDAYNLRGQQYVDIWSDATLAQLPASFSLFKFELQQSDEDHLIPNQPFEEFEKYGGRMDLDRLTAREWITRMPASLRNRIKVWVHNLGKNLNDEKLKNKLELAQRIQWSFQNEFSSGNLAGPTGMQDVIEFMDLYSRSAMGGTSDRISAMVFANFYISEITTRYTTQWGTAIAAQYIVNLLKNRPVQLQTNATVTRIIDHGTSVEVQYALQGHLHSVYSDYVIFGAQLKQAPKLIAGFAEHAPEQAKLMSGLEYSHYSIHVVEVEGHPYRAAYDTWVKAQNPMDDDFTDVILARWLDPAIHAYSDTRDFSHDPVDSDGIFAIYNPLPPRWVNSGYTDAQVRQLAMKTVARFDEIFSHMPSSLWRGPLRVRRIETNRWAYAIHVPQPGHYIYKAKIMRRPFGRVFFANNNLGTPGFEEALFRGHCAADNILARISANFHFEDWTHCPLEQ